ncbi:SDR family oxidoreductase [Pedobacter sp. Leaf194]|uniref:SDR family NAD(P)-dependent oxidoreductase n=1 Tax=Pedobacter sp. Leaf194 TaxID=1736297 RepID=UPI00070273F0|nr:SDR family oxidoreductase [Pedobacter sp. Leaf194]KQS36239.1 short-chain dehydrogenase [Pedobacter sp. Leaf194]
MNTLQGTFALVTGASKGLGRAIAIELAKKGFHLLLVARSENDLAKLSEELRTNYGVTVAFYPIDLSENTSAGKVSGWVEKNDFPVSILVNNAGYGLWGKFDELSLTDQINMCHLNMDVLVALNYMLIPRLSKSNKAYILNVSSTAAYQAVPTLAIYSATKSFVLSFTRAIRYELKNSPIAVSCLSPGPIDTGFAKRAGLDAFSKMAEKFNMKPEEVAKIALKGLFSKKSEIIPGVTNWISVYANRILPKAFIEKMAAGIYKT